MKFKNIVFSTLLAIAVLFSQQALLANTGTTRQSDPNYINNCQAQLQLTPDQVPKFTEDYNSFNTQLAQIKKKYNNNVLLAKGETDKLINQTDKSFKTYLSEAQFKAYKKLFNSGQLGKNTNATVMAGNNSSSSGTSGTKTMANTQSGNTNNAGSSVDVTNLGIEPLVDPLKDVLKLTPDQVLKLKADAKSFDAQLVVIEKQHAGNQVAKNAAVKALTDATIKKMDVYLNNDQLLRFVSACNLQQNIILGKNLTPDQKALVNKMRNGYNMNDAQIMMVALIWSEGRVKLELIKANASKDPQAAVVLTQNTLKAMDNKLLQVMTKAQYDAMRDDVIAQMKK